MSRAQYVAKPGQWQYQMYVYSADFLKDHGSHRTNRDWGGLAARPKCITRLLAFFLVFISDAKPDIISFEYGVLPGKFLEAEPSFDYDGTTEA